MNEHSAKYAKVKGYFDRGLWNEVMVRNAAKNPKAAPWITEEEAEEIISGGAGAAAGGAVG